MLNQLEERGAIKCHQYWPLDPDQLTSRPFSEDIEDQLANLVNLKVELLSVVNKKHFTVRTCRLTDLLVS